MSTHNSSSPPGDLGGPDAIASLVEAVLAGEATAAQFDELRAMLRGSPAALDAYLDQVRADALLRWRSGSVSAGSVGTPAPPASEAGVDERDALVPSLASGERRRWAAWRRPMLAAAVVTLVSAVALVVAWRWSPTRREAATLPPVAAAAPVADVVDVAGVTWANGQRPLGQGDALPPGEVGVASGTLRLAARGDAVISITGPARVRLISGGRVQAHAGRITARVGPAGKGFVVDAPGAEVVDLGTEFGVQVGPEGETAVVVFEGEVDLKRKAASGGAATRPSAPTRLTRGHAVRIAPTGTVDRIVAVERPANGGDWRVDGPPAGDAVIAAVHDNLRDPAGGMYYQVARGGLAEDVLAYVDRPYQWNGVGAAGLPPELIGADLVMPFNDDKRSPELALTVTLARPAVVYVFHEPRHGDVPDWLRRDFTDTGLRIGLDEGPPDLPQKAIGVGPGQSVDRVFSVWRREVRAAGSVVLGENSPAAKSMYGIAAIPLK